MILFDTPRPMPSTRNPRLRRFKTTAHCSSTLTGEAGTRELLAFGRSIGLKSAWLQHRGEDKEHFDLFDGAIGRARAAGAQEVTSREWLHRCVYPKRATPWQPGRYLIRSVVSFEGRLWLATTHTEATPGADGWSLIPTYPPGE